MTAVELAKMSPEAKRIAIAEACGWTDVKFVGSADHWVLVGDEPGSLTHDAIPDYLADLNAMHEAEKALTGSGQVDYALHLADAINPSGANPFQIAHATAAQRADAFLLTLSAERSAK